MNKKLFVITSIGLMLSSGLASAAITPRIINEIASQAYSWNFSTITNVQQISQPVGNLVEYQVSFQDPTLGNPVFYIDSIGYSFSGQMGTVTLPTYYIIPGLYNGSSNVAGYTGQLITDPLQLNILKTISYPLSTPYNILTNNNQITLNAYHPFGSPSTVFINASNSYAEINGSVESVNGGNLLGSQNITLGALFNQNGGIDFNTFDNYLSSYNSFMSQLYNLTKNGNFGTFIEGNPNAPKTILVFGEPNCPICNQLYTATKTYVTSGRLQIHWSLVSFIDQDSRGKVLAILMGNVPIGANYPHTPAGAFAYDEDNFIQGSDDGGGITPIPPTQASAAVITESNNANYFFQSRFDFNNFIYGSTPTILYLDQNGHYQVQIGVPQDMQGFINSIQ